MKRTNYENAFNTYRYRIGTFRIGMDAQIVDIATNKTLANRDEAQTWIIANAHRADKALALRHVYPPGTKPTPSTKD